MKAKKRFYFIIFVSTIGLFSCEKLPVDSIQHKIGSQAETTSNFEGYEPPVIENYPSYDNQTYRFHCPRCYTKSGMVSGSVFSESWVGQGLTRDLAVKALLEKAHVAIQNSQYSNYCSDQEAPCNHVCIEPPTIDVVPLLSR